ncbi:response regulator [Rhizobium sp. L1K21]|uniref:response regulator n=1 Tax=Rhizobium sp. L1K21 TaxID=2954933 RepID=UPI0020937C4A|nr:response regulator transcription factor [Rhizobium sp. L1K21]MCO6185095.1 response regulator transcription factor [Rhizobium sp. L1K21]
MNAALAHIIVVEDDPELGALVQGLLAKEGYQVGLAESGAAFDNHLSTGREPDLVILDVMLPGEDGLSICRRFRLQSYVPVLMLTAKSDEFDRVLGLEMGADDYLVKPFGPRELVARVRALIRRSKDMTAMQKPSNRFVFDGFVIDFDTRILTAPSGEELALTSAEFELMTCFVKRPRRVLSRDIILDFVHGRNADPFDRSVDMLVSRLRKKLETVEGAAGMITTVRNNGYIFTAKDIRAL